MTRYPLELKRTNKESRTKEQKIGMKYIWKQKDQRNLDIYVFHGIFFKCQSELSNLRSPRSTADILPEKKTQTIKLMKAMKVVAWNLLKLWKVVLQCTLLCYKLYRGYRVLILKDLWMLRQEIRRCPAPASVPPRCVHYIVWVCILFVTVEWHEYFNAGFGEGLRFVQILHYLINIEVFGAVTYCTWFSYSSLSYFSVHIYNLS